MAVSPDHGPPAPSLAVTVGTDHHRFDRLIGWIDDWLADRPEVASRCLMQCGPSRPPSHAWSRPFLDHLAVERMLAHADIVVCHAGPATISMARQLGRLPIVVPRTARLREHVDDHQVDFAQRLHRDGKIIMAGGERELRDLLTGGVADPARFRIPPDARSPAATVREFSRLLGELL